VKVGFLLIAASLLAALPTDATGAQQTCAGEPQPESPTATADDLRLPPNSDGPTEVRVGLFVEDLRDIDAVQSSYHFRGVVSAIWCDPRLAFDSAAEGRTEKVYVGPEIDALTEKIWWSGAFPVNQADELRVTERAMRIRHDGTVSRDLNVSVRLSTQYDLRRFPFDHQQLTLEVESFTWSADELVFVADATTTGFDEAFRMPEWTIRAVGAHEERVDVIRSTQPFSRLVLTIDIERKSGFYLWKVLLPLFIIVALSWSIFWMVDERFGIRVRMSASGILTVVAYQFVASQNLPRIGYLTLLDKITIISFLLLATTVLESYIVSRYGEEERDSAHRIDHAARWIFPLGYAALIAMVVLRA
jgi:hypothetical protein